VQSLYFRKNIFRPKVRGWGQLPCPIVSRLENLNSAPTFQFWGWFFIVHFLTFSPCGPRHLSPSFSGGWYRCYAIDPTTHNEHDYRPPTYWPGQATRQHVVVAIWRPWSGMIRYRSLLHAASLFPVVVFVHHVRVKLILPNCINIFFLLLTMVFHVYCSKPVVIGCKTRQNCFIHSLIFLPRVAAAVQWLLLYWYVCILHRGPNRSTAWAMDGRIVRCGFISSCQSAATSEIVKRFWSRVRLM